MPRPGTRRWPISNGDGNPDIVSSNNNDAFLSICPGKGDGTFAPAVFFGANVFPAQIVAGTLDQGGMPGLVLVNSDGQPSAAYVPRNTSK